MYTSVTDSSKTLPSFKLHTFIELAIHQIMSQYQLPMIFLFFIKLYSLRDCENMIDS